MMLLCPHFRVTVLKICQFSMNRRTFFLYFVSALSHRNCDYDMRKKNLLKLRVPYTLSKSCQCFFFRLFFLVKFWSWPTVSLIRPLSSRYSSFSPQIRQGNCHTNRSVKRQKNYATNQMLSF